MLDTNHKNAPCKYAEQIVSHLYGEGEAAEKAVFDAHLQNCSFCADELNNFGFARSAILEWRDEEFSNLATPAFHLPIENQQKSFSVAANQSDSRSWFGNFRNLFAFKPAFAAFAFLLACAAIALVAINFPGGDKEIASNRTDKNTAEKIAAPIDKTKEKPAEIILAEENNEESKPFENVESPREIKTEKPVMPDKTIVKASNAVAPKINADNTVARHSAPKDKSKDAPSIQKQKVPSLNSIEVEEEDSIRLAELFDEIESK